MTYDTVSCGIPQETARTHTHANHQTYNNQHYIRD